MKRNVLEWICSTMTDATSAVVLTHNIDFLFLQSIVQQRLRKCGHPKLTIFADAACARGSYQQQRFLLDGLGRQYRVVPIDMGPGRRFHPKAILLAGPTKAALAVGSGNVTHGGWSANLEIWATFESDDDGLPEISAFRGYLQTVLSLISSSDAVSDEVFAAFDEAANSWVASLPEPRGLYGIPANRSLLDRIVELAGADVQKMTVCAPYYDPDGEALRELSQRFAVPVRTLLQRNHVGLSSPAASKLPQNVELASIDTDPSRFIHAKFYGFQRPLSTLLVVGSANISRAALMADGTWGNAELIAAQAVSHTHADELLADLAFREEAPELPETPPSDEWETPANPLRILTARFSEGMLEIAFKSDTNIIQLIIEAEDGTRKQCDQFLTANLVRVQISKCPRSIRLHSVSDTGVEVSSEPAWVDDEESLGISVPERRIAAKLAEAAEAGSLSANGMFEILQLFHQHLQQPVKRGTHSVTEKKGRTADLASSYSLKDVFSDGFGHPRADLVAALPVGFRESDFFRAFATYFTLADTEEPYGENKLAESPQTDDDAPDGKEPQEIGNENAKEEYEQQRTRHKKPEESGRLRKRLMGALENVVTAMSADEFLSSRSPERLGADIAATALLLRKGLIDDIISEDDFAITTNRLWGILFFGSKGQPSVLQKHLASCAPTESASFEAAIASPRFTAALTLWCFPDWGRDSIDAIRFRFSAMLLAARTPWLVTGGTVEEIYGELRRLSRAMRGVEFEPLVAAWKNWVQAGFAFREFEYAVSGWTAKELAATVTGSHVKRGDLLWQAGELCVADARYRRDSKTKAVVQPLTGGPPRKIMGNWLVPVAALLSDPNLLKLDEGPRKYFLSIVAEVETIDSQGQTKMQSI